MVMSLKSRFLIYILCAVMLSATVNAALTDGLLSYWSFDNNANDIKSTRHGTLNNGVNFSNSDCRLGGCYSFDGINDYISVPSSGLQLSSALTWSGWVRKDGPQPYGYGGFILGVSGLSVSRLLISDNAVLAQVYSGGGNHFSYPNPFSTGSWHHLAYTFNGTHARWYVNGIEFAPNAQNNLPTGTSPISFGMGQSYATYYLNGKLDEIGVWNRALSLSEITQLYNNGKGFNLVIGIYPNCIDNDLDGYGVVADTGCRYPTKVDCNDNNAAINPGAPEVCDGIDNNCNAVIDDGVKKRFYQDADGDGFGNPSISLDACTAPIGYVADNTDTFDGEIARHAYLLPGLLSYWSLDNNANDEMNNRHGTVNEAIYTSSGCKMGGGCYDFDGINDYISVPSSGLQISSALTWSGWVYKDGSQPQGYGGFIYGVSGASYTRLLISDNAVLAQLYSGGGNHFSYPNPFNAGSWHHLAYTFNGTHTRWYVNGIEFAPNAQQNYLQTGTSPISFGKGQDYAVYYLDGKLDEIGIWNRSLSSTDISQLYNNGNGFNPSCVDKDGDGYGAVVKIGCFYPDWTDCDDNNPNIFHGAVETCNGLDDDCDGSVDESLTQSYYTGPGGTQGVGTCTSGTETCNMGVWTVTIPEVIPQAEVCDFLDDDCNTVIDNGFDTDSDGFTTCQGDCNDNNANIHPNGIEVCNAIDDDCDGLIDEALTRPYYTGPGGTQGVGTCTSGIETCQISVWIVTTPQVTPLAEICDSNDNDCNNIVDNGFDLDFDSYTSCAGDCNDANAAISPGDPEVCNGIDDNCNNIIDDGVCAGQCVDNDNDKYGVNNDPSCMKPGVDCNDNIKKVNPGEIETCNTPYDDNCDGLANIGCDNDNDGFTVPSDCNDEDNTVNTGATEVCNSKDDNCDGQIDEISGCTDSDGDIIVDAIDICPSDPTNSCNLNQTQLYVTPNTSQLMNTPEGEAALQISQGDLLTDTVITISKNADYLPNYALSTGTAQAKNIFSYTYSPQGLSFSGNIVVAMYWDDVDNNGREDITNLRENNIDIYWYNTISTQWEAQGASCDLINNYCVLTTNHFSDYALAGAVDSDLDGYYADDCNDSDIDVNPGAQDTACDGVDNNCDDSVDEGYVATPTTCGIGECLSSGELACFSGALHDTCAPKAPALESCDGLDNDCDSITDNGGNSLCNDNLWCNGAEVCADKDGCLAGTRPDCSVNNLAAIEKCDNEPDSNPFSWDFFAGFTSSCDEGLDSCTAGYLDLTHACSKDRCNAECNLNFDCTPTECDSLDLCYDGTYRNYNDVSNACLTSCYCTRNTCNNYQTQITDSDRDGYDTECDNDCNDNDFTINPSKYEIPGNSIDENCDSVKACDSSAAWNNHGQFVSCVTQEAQKLVDQGLIIGQEKGVIVNEAARSDIGKSIK